MVARLMRVFGPARLELAEDVVQEAFVRALRLWSAEGVPDAPEAWLFRVAKNCALPIRVQRTSHLGFWDARTRIWQLPPKFASSN